MTTFGIIAPRLAENGYLPVPIKNGTKRPPMSAWPAFRVDAAALSEYRQCGIGLLCGTLIGVDIDVLHEAAAAELHELARRELGDGPSRIGQPPKLLIAYRTATPFRKRQTRTFIIDGKAAKVEMLADGQQFVAYAVHPDTKQPYRWLDSDPLAIPFADLPEVSEEQIIAVIDKAEAVLGKYGDPQKPERANGSESPREHRQPNDDPARRIYVEAAFGDETKRVATAYAGGRNDALNVAALKLGQLVAGGWLDRNRVERSLEDAAHASGLVRADGLASVRATIASGLAAGTREPRDPPERQAATTGEYRGNGASAPYRTSVAAEPSSWQDDAGASSIPHLSEALWAARPVLTSIREYAHSRTSSGDAALGYLLARTAAFMPHRVRIDSGILQPTPPNLFALLIGGAGAGKSSTHEVFKEILLPDGINDPADYLPVGTGEGVAEAFMGAVEVPGGTKKKPATERRQVRHNAFFTADEGAVIKKLGSRDGATLGETLRRAFTGSTLGQSNASKDTTRKVENYNLGLVANFTPMAAGAVLDDAEAGTPQRFLWFAATDPSMPEDAVSAKPPVINTNPPEPAMWVCPRLRKAIREHRVAVVRGEITIPELDGHKQLIVLGGTPKAERDAAIADFRSGRLRALINVNVLTTGFDAPELDLLAVARPTASTSLHVQMLGRGTRIADGKRDCLVLDFAGNVQRLGPLTAPRVHASNQRDEVAGEASVKVCPRCDSYIERAATICEHCGFIYDTPDRRIGDSFDEVDPLYALPLPVEGVSYTAHYKPGRPASLRITYRLPDRWLSEWLCLFHPGYAGAKASGRAPTGAGHHPMTGNPPKVFISYSHDTVQHQERVLGLADRLRADGVDAEIDQYNASPPEGWPLWCERQIEAADFVLMVCTEIYQRRVKGDEQPGQGRGVVWEAGIIRQILYDAGAVGDKFVPLLFSDASPEQIPTPIKGGTRYVIDTEDGYEDLYRRLTGQPRLLRPALGTIRPMPTRRRQWSEGTMQAASSSLSLRETTKGGGRIDPASGHQEADMGEKTGQGQSGGVNISGSVGSVGGDIVGRDKITGVPSAAALEDALRPLIEAIEDAPADKRAEAEAKLAALKQEAAKGKDANDGVIAKLVDGLVGLVPAAASAAVSAFATPILGGIAGPVTGFVLDKLRGK